MTFRRFIAPEQLELMLTSRCNLRCSYCYFFDSSNEVHRELSTQEWLSLIDEAGRNRVFRIVLSGGEALMREDFEEIVGGIVRNHMRFRLLSNGILLDDAKARFLSKTDRCEYVQISLDGIGSVHDRFRGAGSFDAAVAGIRAAQRSGLRVFSRISLNRHNVDSLAETIRYAKEELKLSGISTNWAMGLAQNQKESGDFQLDLRKMVETLAVHRQLQAVYGSFINSESAPLVGLRMFAEFFKMKKEQRSMKNIGADVMVCPAPACRMTVRADGAYIPCPYLPDYVAGRANDDDMLEVWHNSDLLRKMRANCLDGVDKYQKCQGCEYSPYCRISCPALETEGFGGTANSWCYKKLLDLMPDFDFETMEYRA